MIPNKKTKHPRLARPLSPEAADPAPLAARLHERGLRMTPQKWAIYRLLQKKNYHPTPEMIFAEVRKKYPMTSFGTVYQILEQLHDIGLARRIFSHGNRQRFDGKLEPHAHFVCEKCSRMDDLEDDFVEAFKARFRRKFDFHIRHHYFEFSGWCAQCAVVSRRGEARLE
jgi:Fur family peroxide stress response transcriptional regulator